MCISIKMFNFINKNLHTYGKENELPQRFGV